MLQYVKIRNDNRFFETTYHVFNLKSFCISYYFIYDSDLNISWDDVIALEDGSHSSVRRYLRGYFGGAL